MTISSSFTYKEVKGLKEVKEIVAFQGEIWGHNVVTPLTQLVAASHHGGVVIGAFQQEKLVGFCYGFPGFKEGKTYLVSHMTAVDTQLQNAGVGLHLKLKQREWAKSVGGYEKIVWTFDPLEARNAYFNLMKLGAYTRNYIESYYGLMDDKLNKGLPTDRFLVEWDITSKRVERALSKQHTLSTEINNYPVLLVNETENIESGNSIGYLVPVPTKIQEMKVNDIKVAKKWRYELRRVFKRLIGAGYIVTGLWKDRDPLNQFYIIEKKTLEELDD